MGVESLIWELKTEMWELGVKDWEAAENCELGITETTIRCNLGPPSILLAESLFATLVCSKLCIAFQIIVSCLSHILLFSLNRKQRSKY